MRIFEAFSVLILLASLVSSTYGEKEDMHKRSYTVNPGKVGHRFGYEENFNQR